MRSNSFGIGVVALFAVLVAACIMVEAQGLNASATVEKPFKVSGGGFVSMGLSIIGLDSPHNAAGTATHLGEYSGDEGIATVTNPAGEFKGRYVFVAANGDRLACTYGDTANGAETVGTFTPEPVGDGLFIVVFVAEFNPILNECTGRFAKLTEGGGWIMFARSEPIELVFGEGGFSPPFNCTWEGEGTLVFEEGDE